MFNGGISESLEREVAESPHALGKCKPEDHDRSLPDGDGTYVVSDGQLNELLRTSDVAEALERARTGHGFVTYSDQRVAVDGLLGCNDCGQPLYWCRNDEDWHHVDPRQECFLVGAEV